MKWCRFANDGEEYFGIIEDDKVIQVEGDIFGSYSKTGHVHNLEQIKLLPPIIPPTFYAAGINYPEHVTWAAQMKGEDPVLPDKADIGYRAVNALTGHEDPIIVPQDATEQV